MRENSNAVVDGSRFLFRAEWRAAPNGVAAVDSGSRVFHALRRNNAGLEA